MTDLALLDRRTFLQASAALAAGGLSSPMATARPMPEDEVRDVVVIGSGGAGLAAAIMSAEGGADTLVLEKMAEAGGNTRLADGFNAVDPNAQNAIGVGDSEEKHAEQMLESGRWTANPELVRTVTYGAPETLEWLKACGVVFAPGVYQVYGSMWPRTHSPAAPLGAGYIEPLMRKCASLGVEVRTKTRVLRVLREENGPVTGVEVRTAAGKVRRIAARRGVVVASGGFSANAKLAARFDPKLAGLRTTNFPGATGDLIAPLEDIGAAAVGMEFFQLLPGSAANGRFIGAISPVENMILVNRSGLRFVAEDSPGTTVTDAVLSQPGRLAFPILDASGYAGMKPTSRAAFDEGMKHGDAVEAPSLAALASQLQIPSESLVQTVEEYNLAVRNKKDAIGRNPNMLASPIVKPPFYAAKVSMSINCSLGGIAVTPRAEVLDRHRRVIPRLFAAGEVTGGIHGENLMGGNALAEIFTFGRIAGLSAALGPDRTLSFGPKAG